MSEYLRYPAVPVPGQDLESLYRTVHALYQGYNALTGVPSQTALAVVNQSQQSIGTSIPEGKVPAAGGLLNGLLLDQNSNWLATNALGVMASGFSIQGGGGSNPAVLNSYNASSITREAEGRYRVSLNEAEYAGHDILTYCIPSLLFTPGEEDSTSSLFEVKGAYLYDSDAVAGTFDIQVYELETSDTGANTVIVADPSDLETSERLHCTLFLSGVVALEAPTGL